MKKLHIVIIGGGNMGTAILQALLRVSGISAKQVIVFDRNKVKRDQVKKRFLVSAQTEILNSHLQRADIVVIAVKPQDFSTVAGNIRNNFSKSGLLVTIMAGVKVSTIKVATNCSHIIRIMPNLPMAVGKGFSAWFTSPGISKQQKIFIKNVLVAGGEQIQINKESMFDAITAISGSGPAYLFSFADNLMHAAQRLGVNKTLASQMVLQTLKGSLALLESSTATPDKWQKRVTSKGGTTAAAFDVLSKGRLDKLWLNAVRAARIRSRQLSIILDKALRK